MLRKNHLLQELREIDEQIDTLKKTDRVEASKLKAQSLTIKLLHNIRTNMVAIMRHFNIPLVQPKIHDDDDSQDES